MITSFQIGISNSRFLILSAIFPYVFYLIQLKCPSALRYTILSGLTTLSKFIALNPVMNLYILAEIIISIAVNFEVAYVSAKVFFTLCISLFGPHASQFIWSRFCDYSRRRYPISSKL